MVRKLDSDIDAEVQELQNTIGEGYKGEVLGYAVMYSAGADFNCLVPREWLIERCDKLGVPEDLIPSEPRSHNAYKRAIKRMRESWIEEYELKLPRKDDSTIREGHKVQVNLKEGEGQYIWHVTADVFYNEEESGVASGTWETTDLGFFAYNSDEERCKTHAREGIDESHELYDLWNDVAKKAEKFTEEMKETHITIDIRDMMWKATDNYTDTTIKLKRSVYLFPAGMEDFLNSMTQLYEDINREWKKRGEPMAVNSIEVLNTDDKRSWVQNRVEATLEDSMEKILDDAFDKLGEEASSEIVESVISNLSETDETAETYASLLDAEIGVETLLEEQRDGISDEDKEDIIDEIIDEL